MTKKSKKIFITGATSGIGESLAYIYAKQGAVIGIAGRRTDRLNMVTQNCEKLGGNPISYAVDVSSKSG